MQAEQGRGLRILKQLADDALERMPRDEARSFIDAMSAGEFADVLNAVSAAGIATEGESGGNLFYESAATRIRAADLAIAELKAEVEKLRSANTTAIDEDSMMLRSIERAIRRQSLIRDLKRVAPANGDAHRAKRSRASRPRKAAGR